MGIVEISACIICMNEENNIEKCLDNIYNYVDEIVVIDGGSQDKTLKILRDYKNNKDVSKKLRVYSSVFDGHFGDQKNLAITKSRGIWILSVDADEVFEKTFLKNIRKYTRQTKIEVFAFPRKNYLDGKQTDVYPDHQYRLFRAYCRYIGCVHEEIIGHHGDNVHLFKNNGYHIIHDKSSFRQKNQNIFYKEIENRFPHKILKSTLVVDDE